MEEGGMQARRGRVGYCRDSGERKRQAGEVMSPDPDKQGRGYDGDDRCVVCGRWRGTARRVWVAAHGGAWAWARKARDCSSGGVQEWASWRRVAPRQVDYDEGPAGRQFVRSPSVTLSSSPLLLPHSAPSHPPCRRHPPPQQHPVAPSSTVSCPAADGALRGPWEPLEPASPSTCFWHHD